MSGSCRPLPKPPKCGTGTSPLYFSSRPPQASERVPPVVNCSRRPHSSDASSVPTRLTRSSRRLCVLFDVPLLPTRASPSPRSRPGHQERPRPSWGPFSSLPPSHHPQHDVLSSGSLALAPVHGCQNLLETPTSPTTRPSTLPARPLLDRLSQGWKLSPANTPLVLLAPSCLPTRPAGV